MRRQRGWQDPERQHFGIAPDSLGINSIGGRVMRISKTIFVLTLIVTTLLIACRPIFAETTYLFGKIGDLPVSAALERGDGKLSGWYFYHSNAGQIHLEGSIDRQGAFQMEETSDGKKTGIFKGSVKEGRWTGTWQKLAGGKPLSLSLIENHNLLKNLNGEFRGTAQERVPKYRYTYKWDIKLSVIEGVVKTLESTQGSYGDNKDEQTCSIDMKDLEQVPSEVGILLQTKADDSNEDDQRCTVRILGDGDTIWVRFGDASEEGNDCRSLGSNMYCSPRAFWNDLLIDRRTQKCKAIK
jgi:hypothetical protein